jgi:hypothetical protein
MSLYKHVWFETSDGKWYHDTPWETTEGPFETQQQALDSMQSLSEKLSIQDCISKRHPIRLYGTDPFGSASCTICGRTYNVDAVLNGYLEKLEETLHKGAKYV